MRGRAVLGLLAFGLLACQEQSGLSGGADGVSSLAAVEDDRLWILLQAARLNPRCGSYYASAQDDPMADLAAKCASFERRALQWLHVNGVVDVTADDLRNPELWTWYRATVKEIGSCRERARSLPVAKDASILDESLACDPYQRIVRVQKKTLEEAGYHRPSE
jgi:hypothetical protein